jgi:hypothetical protein
MTKNFSFSSPPMGELFLWPIIFCQSMSVFRSSRAPTNQQGQTDVASLEALLRHERTPQTFITFLACTDDLGSVNYLSNWDKTMPNLDVIDDYTSERAEIHRTRGPNFPFSFGDYIVKALLGSMDPWYVLRSSSSCNIHLCSFRFDSLDDRT